MEAPVGSSHPPGAEPGERAAYRKPEPFALGQLARFERITARSTPFETDPGIGCIEPSTNPWGLRS